MTTIEYTLTPDQLSDAIDNTIRVFDQYRLRRRRDSDGKTMIIDKSWKGRFNYFITETPGGSKLTLEAKAAMPVLHEESFFKNLHKIIHKEIAITPEILRKDIYKHRKMFTGWKSIIWIAVIIILIIKMVQGFMKR